MAALDPSYRATEERALVLDIMTSHAILQPHAIPALLPDLPSLIMRELRLALNSRDAHRESTPIAAALLFLASALHTSTGWMQQYWMEAAEMMSECITAGQAIPVLKGLDVILDAVSS